MMMNFRRWRDFYHRRQEQIPDSAWAEIISSVPLVARYSSAEREKLRGITSRFVNKKDIRGMGGLEVNDSMRFLIAALSCVPILGLDLNWYAGWVSVLVYPAGFVAPHEFRDEAGVMHRRLEPLSGESWLRGPVILSWEDVANDAFGAPGRNVVIHELAHKLDGLNGVVNGMPPLHRDMDRKAWTAAFTDAFEDLRRRLSEGEWLPIDAYGAETPGEFFAVATETFFVGPVALQNAYPAVYQELCLFYRQQPAGRVGSPIGG